MKKLLLILPLLFLCTKVWAISDWSPVTEIKDVSQANYLTSSNAAVCSVVVTGIGVTVGDYVQLLNSTTSTGSSQLTVTAATANFTVPVKYTPCNLFSTGVYVNVSKSSGHMYTDIQYLNAI